LWLLLGCVKQRIIREALCGVLVADYHGVFSVVVVSDGALLA
jgi:hypothetical protein